MIGVWVTRRIFGLPLFLGVGLFFSFMVNMEFEKSADADLLMPKPGWQKPNLPHVHGHRGNRGGFPENTLPAFQSALEAGVEALELDLAVTRDNVLVVVHDPHVNLNHCSLKTKSLDTTSQGRAMAENLDEFGDSSATNRGPLVRSLTLQQLQQYDCGGKRHPGFPNQKLLPGVSIPTLDEVFALARSLEAKSSQKVYFNIEPKTFPDHPEWTLEVDKLVQLVLESLKKNQVKERAIIQSFNPKVLASVKRQDVSVIRSFLTDNKEDLKYLAESPDDAQIISPYFKLLTPALMEKFQARGLPVIPWTANHEEDWIEMISLGVDAIITDYPAELKVLLGSL